MQIIYKNTDELIPYIDNPRQNDIAGDTRLKASKKINLDKVPCIIADDLTAISFYGEIDD